MHGIAKALLGSAATIVLASGALALSVGEASAQFNIEGMIRGAIAHGGYYGGGRYSRHRGRVHETKRGRHSKEAKEEDKDKSDKADRSDKQTEQANQTDHSDNNRAEDKGPPPSAPTINNTASKQPAADMPSLTPER